MKSNVFMFLIPIYDLHTGRQSEAANPPPASPDLDDPSDGSVLLGHSRILPPTPCTELPLACSAEAGVIESERCMIR